MLNKLANGNFLYDSGNSDRDSISTKRGRVGREMGRRFRGRGNMYPYG